MCSNNQIRELTLKNLINLELLNYDNDKITELKCKNESIIFI